MECSLVVPRTATFCSALYLRTSSSEQSDSNTRRLSQHPSQSAPAHSIKPICPTCVDLFLCRPFAICSWIFGLPQHHVDKGHFWPASCNCIEDVRPLLLRYRLVPNLNDRPKPLLTLLEAERRKYEQHKKGFARIEDVTTLRLTRASFTQARGVPSHSLYSSVDNSVDRSFPSAHPPIHLKSTTASTLPRQNGQLHPRIPSSFSVVRSRPSGPESRAPRSREPSDPGGLS